jgi:hypothetical protein
VISVGDMVKFIETIGNEYQFLDLYEEGVENAVG